MRQDIISALKNAIERGSSLEQAKQSLINAGYKQEEVEESARSLTGFFKPEYRVKQQEQIRMPETPELPELPPRTLLQSQAQIAQQQPQQMPQPQIIIPQQPQQIPEPRIIPPQQPQQLPQPQTPPQQPQQPPQLQSQRYMLPVSQAREQEETKASYERPGQSKPRRTGLIVLLVVLAILIGAIIFIFFAKDAVFGLFGEVVKKLG